MAHTISLVESHSPYAFQAVTWYIDILAAPLQTFAGVWNGRDPTPTVVRHARGRGVIPRRPLYWEVDEKPSHSPAEVTRTVSLVSKDRLVGSSFIEEALHAYRARISESRTAQGVSFFAYEDEWQLSGVAPRRPLESVFLKDPAIMESLLGDMKSFLSKESKARFITLHIPMIRTYMFHGCPGSGKSALIHCLASECGLNVARFSGGNAEDLAYALRRVPPASLLVIDDIDAIVQEGRAGTPGFAATLQALDGVARSDPLVVCMTSNVPQQLDVALRRRVDVAVQFEHATREQCEAMYTFFFEGDTQPFGEVWERVKNFRPFPCSVFHKLLVRSLSHDGGPCALLKKDPGAFEDLMNLLVEDRGTRHIYS